MKILTGVLCLLALGLQFRLWAGEGSYAHIRRLEERIAAQRVENDTLARRNQVLYQEVDELKSGLDAIEERARFELGMIKKGETFYLIVEGESGDGDKE